MQSKTFFQKILFLVSLIIVGGIVGSIFTIMLIQPVFNINIMDDLSILSAESENPATPVILKFAQICQVVFTFIIPVHLYTKWVREDETSSYLKLKSFSFKNVLIGLVLIVSISPFVAFLSDVNNLIVFPESMSGLESFFKNLELRAEKATQIMLTANGVSDLLLNLFIVGVLAAISEEFLFRGVLQKIIIEKTKNIHVGILITAVIFSAIHLQFYGFLPRLFLGLLLGYLFVGSGSLWVPIFAHFLNNAVAVILDYCFKNNLIAFDPNTNEYFGVTGVIISLVITISVFWYWYKQPFCLLNNGKRLG